eukprot:48731-Eustigmatos_ZCMA.PRE.1
MRGYSEEGPEIVETEKVKAFNTLLAGMLKDVNTKTSVASPIPAEEIRGLLTAMNDALTTLKAHVDEWSKHGSGFAHIPLPADYHAMVKDGVSQWFHDMMEKWEEQKKVLEVGNGTKRK